MTDPYLQPDFYRFNEDSIHLVKFALKHSRMPETVLDLCAGCGVIGIEFALGQKSVRVVEFVELQVEFKDYLEANTKILKEIETKIHINSLGQFKNSATFDLILCNPPYYLKNEGRVSPDVNRAHARCFLIDDLVELIACLEHTLEVNGQAFLVLKPDEKLKELILEKSRVLRVHFVIENKLMFVCFEHKEK